MNTPQNVIRIENVSRWFDDHLALDNVSLQVYDGEFLTILGPSGCGKTTLLRLMGGFETPSSGQIYLDGELVNNTAPEDRKVNTVFQGYALFPHMTVYDNVAFGLRMSGMPEKEISVRVSEVLRLVQLENMAGRKPSKLSGGQQQRVAIARAVVNRPRVLLLDESLSALDARLRKTMQTELKNLHKALGITFVFVTHDQKEALSMSDRVVVMNDGVIEQIGTPVEVYEEPLNRFVASFVGETNFLEGVITAHNGDVYSAEVEGRPCQVTSQREFAVGSRILLLLRPEDLCIDRSIPEGDESLWLRGTIKDTTYQGTTYDLCIELLNGREIYCTQFFNEDAEDMSYQEGDEVVVSWYDGWEVVLPYEEKQ